MSISQLVDQLRHPDPGQRRQAILALGKSKDPAALRPLAEVFKGDPEPELRDLARKAGLYIRQQNGAGVSSPQPTAAADTPRRKSSAIRLIGGAEEAQPEATPEAPRHIPVRGREYNVPREKRESAQKAVDAALTYNLNGDNARAMKNLAEALSLDPNLINDAYFNSVATSVTGLDGEAAIQLIVDRGQRRDFSDKALRAMKQRRIDEHMSVATKTSWTDVAFEAVLYTLIVTLGPILATLVTVESALNFFNSFGSGETELPQQILDARESLTTLTGATLIPVGIVSGISGVIGLLLQLGLVHVLATKVFSGHGTIRHQLTVLLGFYNKWLPFIFLISYLTTAVYFVSGGSPIVLCFVLILTGLSLYVSGKTSSKIGEAYDFGAARGCLSYSLAVLLISVVTVVLVLLLAQIAGTAALEQFFRLQTSAS